MTSALEGGGVHGKADKGNRGCVNVTVTRGEGVKKSGNFACIEGPLKRNRYRISIFLSSYEL